MWAKAGAVIALALLSQVNGQLTIPPRSEWPERVAQVENLTQPYGGNVAYTEENYRTYFGDDEEMAFRHIPELRQKSFDTLNFLSPHEMDWKKPHIIETLYVKDDSGEIVFLAIAEPGNGIENIDVDFEIVSNQSQKLTPYSHCNLHGLWQGNFLRTVDAASWNATKSAIERGLGSSDSCPSNTGALFALDDTVAVQLSLVDIDGNVLTRESTNKPVAVDVRMEFPKEWFFAVGFNNHMTPTDMIVCAHNGTDTGCWDYFAVDRVTGPRPDEEFGGRNDVTLLEWSINASDVLTSRTQIVKVHARKVISSPTGQSDAAFKTEVGEAQDIVFAFSKISPQPLREHKFLHYHGLDRRGYLSVDLRDSTSLGSCSTSNEREVRDLQIMHGVMMYLLWAVNITTGAILARYWRNTTWWLGAHRILQTIGTIITIPGFYLTFQWETTKSSHSKMGKFIVYTSWIQASMGMIMYQTSQWNKLLVRAAKENKDLTLGPDSLELVNKLGEMYGFEFMRYWQKERHKASLQQRKEIDAFITAQIDALGIPLLPTSWLLFLMKTFRQRIARPLHRMFGRTLPIIAFVQIYLGASLIEADKLVFDMLIAWSVLIGTLVVYKELELQFDLPNKTVAAFKKLSSCCCKAEPTTEDGNQSQTNDPLGIGTLRGSSGRLDASGIAANSVNRGNNTFARKFDSCDSYTIDEGETDASEQVLHGISLQVVEKPRPKSEQLTIT